MVQTIVGSEDLSSFEFISLIAEGELLALKEVKILSKMLQSYDDLLFSELLVEQTHEKIEEVFAIPFQKKIKQNRGYYQETFFEKIRHNVHEMVDCVYDTMVLDFYYSVVDDEVSEDFSELYECRSYDDDNLETRMYIEECERNFRKEEEQADLDDLYDVMYMHNISRCVDVLEC